MCDECFMKQTTVHLGRIRNKAISASTIQLPDKLRALRRQKYVKVKLIEYQEDEDIFWCAIVKENKKSQQNPQKHKLSTEIQRVPQKKQKQMVVVPTEKVVYLLFKIKQITSFPAR
jgi:hypothetical protein